MARVTAETPAAAQALADGRAELHQSLSSLGATLLRLDIGTFGCSEGRPREHARRRGSVGALEPTDAPEEDETVERAGAAAHRRSRRGELVDVLA